MQANNVIMITACGNDGKYGTINNPADQLSVIGVGGITQNNQQIASFQSRGMTTWELHNGYGRVKPDIVTVGQSLYGSSIDGGCRTLSGTSVASPVATGVAALLTSVVPYEKRWDIINPASLKQVFVETADTINGLRLFEQGNGKINLQSAYQYIKQYQKHVSAVPDALDFTSCPHLWPFCRQPLYYSSQPYIFNLTLLNPFSVLGEIPKEPKFEIDNIVFDDGQRYGHDQIYSKDGINPNLAFIEMEFKYSKKMWPWCGWLGIYIYAEEVAKDKQIRSISGSIKLEIWVIDDNPERQYNSQDQKWVTHRLSIPYSLTIIPTPIREKRILWDQYHNLAYPLGYFPRDDLEKDGDMLDWFGDHLHTNYHTLYDFIKDKGYFIEVLTTDYSCIDPDLYSTLVIIDPEDKFHENEIKKLEYDVMNKGLSVIIFADWYNEQLINDVRFFDDNTRSLWDALTGGSNIVALNQILEPFDIQFGDMTVVGDINIGPNKAYFQSGSTIMKAPVGSFVLKTTLQHITDAKGGKKKTRGNNKKVPAIPLMIYDTKNTKFHPNVNSRNRGRIGIFGDSTCLDANQHKRDCFWLFDMMLHFSCYNEIHNDLQQSMTRVTPENMNDIFNRDYLSRMKKPGIVKLTEDLFNDISRTENLRHVQCYKQIQNILSSSTSSSTKPEKKEEREGVQEEVGDDIKSGKQLQAKQGDIEPAAPLINDEQNNKNNYQHVMNPHLGSNAGHNVANSLGMNHYDILLIYPFIILILFIIMICMFCRPIRKLFFFDKLSPKVTAIFNFGYRSMGNKNAKRRTALTLRKVKNTTTAHEHV